MKLAVIKRSFEECLRKKFPILNAEFPAFLFLPPPGHIKADISIPWPMQAGKKLKTSPMKTADEAAGCLSGLEGIASAESSAPGFVNITLDTGFLREALREILAEPENFAALDPKPREKILLEFVSANPTGPLHMASGRGAVLGDSLARIFKFLGYKISSEYYVNDAGRQVELLGKSLKARYEGKEPPEDGYKGGYLAELAKKLDKNLNWSDKEFSLFAVKELLALHKKDMDNFGVSFDKWFFESELHKNGFLDKALELLRQKNRVYEKDGAVWFGAQDCGSQEKEDAERVLVKSNGQPSYFLGDIAYHINKYGRGYDRLINILGADHHGFLPRMKAALSALGYSKESFSVIIHQFVRLCRGGQGVKMSKRAGEFVSLEELINDAGKDACRFFFAMRTPDSHLNFDLDLAKKQTSENPVFYVQYVHARICSIFRQAQEKGMAVPDISALAGVMSQRPEEEERRLLIKMAWFQETLEACARDLSPHHLTAYLLEFAGLFHPFYEKCKVVDAENRSLTDFRLLLCRATKQVIARGLGLLGVSAPEKM